MARSITDARQVTLRSFLQQITNRTAYTGTADSKPANQIELDNLLTAISEELTPLLRLTASNPIDRVVSVGAGVLTNSETGFARSIPHVGALLPAFTSGTVTFPATSGGTITVSPGNNGTLTVSSGNYIKVLIYMDATGALNVLPGVENATESLATVLKAPNKTLPIGYVTLQNVAGTIQNITQAKIYQFGTGAGGGSGGSGTGVGSDLGVLTFKAEFNDEFDDIPSASTSAVDITTDKTDSTTYSAANAYYRLAYDASRTVTGTGTSMTLSGTPSFTVKNGDMLIVGTEARRITNVASQTSYTIESAFTTNPSAAAATVSQAVYTKDLNNTAVDGLAVSAAFSTTISQVMVDYEDTTAQDDVIFDANSTPVIAFSASSDNSSYSAVAVRPTNLTDSQSIVNLPTAGTNLYVRFFANKSSGTGFVNILKHHTYFHRDLSYLDGSLLNSSYCMSDGTGTEINCSAPSVVSGKTRVQTTFTFPVGVNSGTTNGALKVYLNGQKIPRFIDSTLTPDASYREIDQRTIELDSDYSALQYPIEIVMDVAVVDSTDANVTNISQLQESNQQGFQGFVNDNARLTATSSAGSPAAGTFHSTVINRPSIPDLASNLKAHMGLDRVSFENLVRINNEFGPSGEPVFSHTNDSNNLVRFVGQWGATVTQEGQIMISGISGDYMEITFYGTGLNIMTLLDSTRDFRVSIDGGAEGAQVYTASGSNVLRTRGYSSNQVVAVASGLSLGVHTARIRSNAVGGQIATSGYEVLNDSSTIRLNPGSAFVNGKKLSLSSQQSLTHNSGFESGTLGTRGGRVLTYIKSDGTIGRAVQPVNASQANLSSADHTNEEVARIYHFREFGTSRADDFSSAASSATDRAFVLNDDSTVLNISGATVLDTGYGEGVGPNALNNTLIFTFVGTGLDIINVRGAALTATYTITIDGVDVAVTTSGATLFGPSNGNQAKIVSGLPYGSHTVHITMTANGTGLTVSNFIVYQPKKPSLPSGAVELADYNVMANYSAATLATALSNRNVGTLVKTSSREFNYVGAGWAIALAGEWSPNLVTSSTAGNYVEYTFYGTGIVFIARSAGVASTATVQIDGVAYTGAAGVIGTGSSWTPGTSTFTMGAAANSNTQLQISGLSLGRHTIRVTVATNSTRVYGMEVITPIHTNKIAGPGHYQNNLPTGSCGISDTRKTSPIKEIVQSQNSWSQAYNDQNPTTSSSTFLPYPELAVQHFNKTGRIRISYSINMANVINENIGRPYIDGIGVGLAKSMRVTNATGPQFVITDTIIVPVSPGFHNVAVYWRVGGGTATGIGANLTVEDA